MTKKNNNYRGMCIAVAGFGKTGRALLDFLLETKEYGTLYLFNDESLETGEQADSRKEYENRGVTFIIGSGYFSQLESAGLVIVSPGVDARTPRFELLRKKGIKIVSEIEFACTFIEAPVIAVTGTNGKSTTVSLIHHMLSKNGVNSFLAGNIGTPLISEVGKISADAVVVVEVSSFQLEEIEFFRPHIALILNITPDHLDRYHSMEDYITAKLNVGKNQDNGDFLILNAGDPLLKERGEAIGAARKVWFSRSPEDTGAVVRLEGDWIHLDVGAGEETVSLIRNPLRGVHNLENLLAAVITVRLMGVPAKGIETAVEDFEGLEHRMETVEKIGHVEFINDSKATNVDAALKSVAGIDTHMVLILGGKDKGGDFTLLQDAVREKVDFVLLVGEAAHNIFLQLEDLEEKLLFAADFSQAVERGYRLLEKSGGVVLLAPACASFDMFDNFEHRGRVFKEEVRKLAAALKPRRDGGRSRNG